MKSNEQIIKSILSGKKIHSGDLEYSWQEFVLHRIEVFNEDTEDNIESQFIGYNRGFLDGFKMASKLVK